MIALNKAVYTRMVVLGYTVEWGDARPGTAMPYIVLRSQPGLMPDYTMEDVFTEPRVVRCQVFDTTMESVAAILENIEALFVGQDVPLDQGRILTIRKGSDDCFLEPERDPEYGDIWQGVLDLEFECQRRVPY